MEHIDSIFDIFILYFARYFSRSIDEFRFLFPLFFKIISDYFCDRSLSFPTTWLICESPFPPRHILRILQFFFKVQFELNCDAFRGHLSNFIIFIPRIFDLFREYFFSRNHVRNSMICFLMQFYKHNYISRKNIWRIS